MLNNYGMRRELCCKLGHLENRVFEVIKNYDFYKDLTQFCQEKVGWDTPLLMRVIILTTGMLPLRMGYSQ